MGYGKCFEDNERITEDRFYMRDTYENCCIINFNMFRQYCSREDFMQAEKIERKDMTLVCRDCGEKFVFSAGEQEFFHNKGLCTPKRCKECRKKRRS